MSNVRSSTIQYLLVPRTEHHLSSFKCGFLNIFSRQTLLRRLSRLLFLLRWNKYRAKKCLRNHIPFNFWDDSTLANQGAGKTIEKPLKELPWNQQISHFVLIWWILLSLVKFSLTWWTSHMSEAWRLLNIKFLGGPKNFNLPRFCPPIKITFLPNLPPSIKKGT